MSPRTGRPRLETPINQRVSVRLDAETMKRLEEYCEEQEKTKGEAIREGVKLLLARKEK